MRYQLLTVLAAVLFCGPANGHPANGMVVDRSGYIYVSDVSRNVIWRISPAGRTTRYLDHLHSHDLWIDSLDQLHGEHLDFRASENAFYYSYWIKPVSGPIRWVKSPSKTRQLPVMCPVNGLTYLWSGDNTNRQNSSILAFDADDKRTALISGPYGLVDGPTAFARIGAVAAMCVSKRGELFFVDEFSLRRLYRAQVTTLVKEPANKPDGLLQNKLGWSGNLIFSIALRKSGALVLANFGSGDVVEWAASSGLRKLYHAPEPWTALSVLERVDGTLLFLENSLSPGHTERLRLVAYSGHGSSRVIAEF